MKYPLAILAMLIPAAAGATPLALDEGYLHKDGAIQTYYRVPERIDPYFPTKGILLTMDGGNYNDAIAQRWIGWLISRQEPDGLFSRFCLNEGEQAYQACEPADADDSMMAMWIELLYRAAPKSGLPSAWSHSAKKAETQLDALFSEESNIYHISRRMQVGLLMDNIEIYAALRNAAKEARAHGDLRQSASFYTKAARLKSGIMQTFWDDGTKSFRASTQARAEHEFYPDDVAQMIPLLHNFHTPRMQPVAQAYAAWMRDHKDNWFSLLGTTYPWGVIAMVATRNNDFTTANCWLQLSAPYRHSKIWDVMDEAAYQSVEVRLKKEWPEGLPHCEGARA